jgi:hypothetical protein
MDPSEANLAIWIEPTSLLRSGLLTAVFPWMTEAMWLVWTSWTGAAGEGGAAAPGGSADPASWPRCIASVVHLIDPTRSCRVESFRHQCMEPYLVGTCIGGKVGVVVPLGAVEPTICGSLLRNGPLVLVLQIKTQHNSWNLVST